MRLTVCLQRLGQPRRASGAGDGAKGSTGSVEKVVLLLLIGGCIYAAAKVTALSEWLVHRLAHR